MNIQYTLANHSLEQNRAILKDAFSVCYEWWVDTIPGFQRQRIDMSFEDIMKMAVEDCYYTCFFRSREYNLGEEYYEFGFSTHTDLTHMLWIKVSPEEGSKIIEEYNIPRKRI